MNFTEARLIYNQTKADINSELDAINSTWKITELMTRLVEIQNKFNFIELQEAIHILLPERDLSWYQHQKNIGISKTE